MSREGGGIITSLLRSKLLQSILKKSFEHSKSAYSYFFKVRNANYMDVFIYASIKCEKNKKYKNTHQLLSPCLVPSHEGGRVSYRLCTDGHGWSPLLLDALARVGGSALTLPSEIPYSIDGHCC